MPWTRVVLAFALATVLAVPLGGASQAKYDDYLTGDAADVQARTRFGLGLMGGGTDVDALFTWMSDRAGGDFVVIRASGADGYNQYVYDLGTFNSVETLVLKNREASSDPFVLQTIRNAEALFVAGGDQSNYINFWKDTPIEDAIQGLAGAAFRSPARAPARRSSPSSCTPGRGFQPPRPMRSPTRTIATSRSIATFSCCRTWAA